MSAGAESQPIVVQTSQTPIILSAVIAISLVLLYAGIVVSLVITAFSSTTPADTPQQEAVVFTTIGGLISALAVAVLAATTPGESPAQILLGEKSDINVQLMRKDPSQPHGMLPMSEEEIAPLRLTYQTKVYQSRETWLQRTIWFYLIVWTVSGMAALIVGVLIKPGIVPVLENTGTTWLGIAVAAVYAYLGIRPK